MVVADEMMSDCEKRIPDPVGPYMENAQIDPFSKDKNHVGPDPSLHPRCVTPRAPLNVRSDLCQMAGSVKTRRNGPARR